MNTNSKATTGTMAISPDGPLPEPKPFADGIRRAPDRGYTLTRAQTILALKNALRAWPDKLTISRFSAFEAALKSVFMRSFVFSASLDTLIFFSFFSCSVFNISDSSPYYFDTASCNALPALILIHV